MIIDSFSVTTDNENSWCNVFIEPVDIEGKTVYVVGLSNPGEGIPSAGALHQIALTAETISPFQNAVSLEVLCTLIQDAVRSGTWAAPFVISEDLIKIEAPASAFKEGQSDAIRGLHFNANPHLHGTQEADDWDEGWAVGRSGNFDGLNH